MPLSTGTVHHRMNGCFHEEDTPAIVPVRLTAIGGDVHAERAKIVDTFLCEGDTCQRQSDA